MQKSDPAAEAHWARVRRGIDAVEMARRYNTAPRYPVGSRTRALVDLAAFVKDVPGRREIPLLRLRCRLGRMIPSDVLRGAASLAAVANGIGYR